MAGTTITERSELVFLHRRAKGHSYAVVPAALLAGLATAVPWYFSIDRDDGIDLNDPHAQNYLNLLGETMVTIEDVDEGLAKQVIAELGQVHPEVFDALRRWIDLQDGAAGEEAR